MASDLFKSAIDDGWIPLTTASDVVRFSFIAQDSISYLDLEVFQDPRNSDYFRSFCDSCRSRRLTDFVNTEEKCRQFFAPSRRLLYTLNLDLPRGRECKLKGEVPIFSLLAECCQSLHVVDIAVPRRFYTYNLSNFIEKALDINIPKEKILKWIVKISFRGVPLLFYLEIRTASKFIDCFYPKITDDALFSEFIKQFEITEFMIKLEQPEILEFLLYHANRLGNLSLDGDFDFELINLCIYYKHYRNIGPILKYLSDPESTNHNYENYFFFVASERAVLIEDVIEKAKKSMSKERMCHIMQVVTVFMDNSIDASEDAREALRLIWSSVPDACATIGELKYIFEAEFSEEVLTNIHDFYVDAIGEFHECVEPRSLQHACRVVLRRTFEVNKLWIPDAIRRMGLPKSLQSFLNLES